MQTIKERILEYFDRNHYANVSELSYTLGVTKPNIHYHLKKLIKSGILEIYKYDHRHNVNKKGRPEIYYRKANKSKPNNYQILSSLLLQILFKDKTRDHEQSIIIHKIATALSLGMENVDNIVHQIQTAVTKLETLNYDPHWEISKDGPLISFRNCPYAGILTDHPILCQIDCELLQHLTGATINQIAFIHEKKTRPPTCVFLVSLNGS